MYYLKERRESHERNKGDIDPFKRVRSCTDIKNRYPDATSKVYTIYPDGKTPKLAYCDMVTEGGGWTVFQRRTDGSVDFYRGWSDYKSGFGNTSNEYWLGNEAIHKLTENGTCVLRIDMVTLQNERGFSKFTNFTISSEDVGYKMDYDRYSGTAGEAAFSYHKGMKFSTKDVDNDKKGSNCAQEYTGAWWYNACHHSNLNGKHGGSGNTYMRWWDWKDTKKDAFMKETIMMIKC
ncbi:hypothetical protein FSP39_019805 [Pinctada imbricata]|uniref:Fibrinogen C-terminal domain-containing protein n=1 Tax=Pinctada imbricata TaxID=66713 RepID=A0AA89BPN9_PINIB|nr:hypothetical protein FSP39_019805 [Pinctada imbricata]